MRPVKKLALILFLVSFMLIVLVISGCSWTAPADVQSELATLSVIETEPEQPQKLLRKGIQTILVMGLDEYERPEKPEGYMNGMLSDFLLLVVVDEANQKIEALHINRDTMTKVPRLGVFGDAAGSFTGQIALAHTYGSGGSDSCLNTVKAVSKFLGGVKIDHYMSFTMSSVGIINDMVGGVTVRINDDFSEVDPTMEIGQEITLKGDQALLYVRTRRDVGDQTNIGRMERQREYMHAMYQQVASTALQDENFVKNLVLKLSDSFMTDFTISQMEKLSQTMVNCSMSPFLTIAGEARVGERYMEFYPDPASVQSAVDQLFYEP